MVNAISNNLNPIQMLNAVNAFRAGEQVQNNNKIPETSDGINLNDNNILKNHDTEEIIKFAQSAGEESLSTEDIQYGLTYGRSVIADYLI